MIPDRVSDRLFFGALASAIVALVFVGFARTFYLHTFFGVQAPARFMIFHGSLMSGWILLLLVQATLISTHRIRWHRHLGVFGVGYAAVVVVVGCMTTLIAAGREVRAHSADVASQLDVLALELTQMLLFGCLVAAAVTLRNRFDWHKRLIVLATLCILPNVIVRISFWSSNEFFQQNVVLLTMWAVLVLAVVALDSYRHRRVHAAFGILGAVVVAAMYGAHWVGTSETWRHLASRLVS